ncbi:hypothetical protein [Nostoc sp. TCL26-01]|uniref:hypothetical protein n=1 Tax=Nostoc sp. TCL26-01 TaxID=2576904 RepID=UPI0015BA70EA|nr:hypothetical protein [Nostoc sp. TCL26-01]
MYYTETYESKYTLALENKRLQICLCSDHLLYYSSDFWAYLQPYPSTGYRRIISASATASPSGVYTVSPDIAITILCCLAHSNQSFTADLTCADSGFRLSLQAATNTASGDLIPFQVRRASLR